MFDEEATYEDCICVRKNCYHVKTVYKKGVEILRCSKYGVDCVKVQSGCESVLPYSFLVGVYKNRPKRKKDNSIQTEISQW